MADIGDVGALFLKLKRCLALPAHTTPYNVEVQTLKQHYKKFLLQNHPDKTSEGDEETVKFLTRAVPEFLRWRPAEDAEARERRERRSTGSADAYTSGHWWLCTAGWSWQRRVVVGASTRGRRRCFCVVRRRRNFCALQRSATLWNLGEPAWAVGRRKADGISVSLCCRSTLSTLPSVLRSARQRALQVLSQERSCLGRTEERPGPAARAGCLVV